VLRLGIGWLRKHSQYGILLSVVIAWVILVTSEILPGVRQVTPGFAAYYAASYAVLHGGAADLNNNQAFAVWVARSGIDMQEVFAGNAPTLALFGLPFTLVSPDIAQTLWLLVNVALLVAASWLAGRLCAPLNVTARLAIIAVFALLAPVHETLYYGQVYLLLAFLSLVALAALRSQHDILAGIAVAGMALLKPYYGVLTFGLLIWSRRPRSILAMIGISLLVVVASLPLLAQAWPGFVQAQGSIEDMASASVPANQTLNSLMRHLFEYSPGWNPDPLANLPLLATGLRYALSLFLVSVTVWRAAKHQDDPFWIWPLALTLMPVLAPVGETHHDTLLLLPIAVAVTWLLERKARRLEALLIVTGLFLLIVPWPSLHDSANWQGWLGLLAYPRLMGAMLLWMALLSCEDTTDGKFLPRTPQRLLPINDP